MQISIHQLRRIIKEEVNRLLLRESDGEKLSITDVDFGKTINDPETSSQQIEIEAQCEISNKKFTVSTMYFTFTPTDDDIVESFLENINYELEKREKETVDKEFVKNALAPHMEYIRKGLDVEEESWQNPERNPYY